MLIFPPPALPILIGLIKNPNETVQLRLDLEPVAF